MAQQTELDEYITTLHECGALHAEELRLKGALLDLVFTKNATERRLAVLNQTQAAVNPRESRWGQLSSLVGAEKDALAALTSDIDGFGQRVTDAESATRNCQSRANTARTALEVAVEVEFSLQFNSVDSRLVDFFVDAMIDQQETFLDLMYPDPGSAADGDDSSEG